MDLIEDRLHRAYKKVDYFPEDQKGGWANMLALRKLVPESVNTLREQRRRIEKLEAQVRELEGK